MQARGQGGLLDVKLDPRFTDNRLVYLSYAGRAKTERLGLQSRVVGSRTAGLNT